MSRVTNLSKLRQERMREINLRFLSFQQQKTALMKNNVPLRAKTQGMRERPTSAIYPSESFRQSLLRSRRGRSHLSLSKSVSTNNIVGSLNDDAPLGLRRILSQSTDSLSFRNRTMSMESLNDDGELYYASVLEEIELEGQDFKADSWSMAVDSSYLQTHRKNVIKRQDVIYGDQNMICFSGQSADDMQKTYAEFCSRHLKAVKLYKELLAKDKKFQFFIRQVSRGPLLRCHGVQECILLVTQRMFKYPALIQRILDNTTDDEEEASSVAQALLMIRELLSSIDQQDKPPVLSLQNLIVRDIANQERGMYLISDSTPPEMYEFYAASKDDKNIWIRHVQHAVSKCPSREEFPLIESEHKAHLRRLKADLQHKDQEMLELLQERVTLFCELAEVTSGQESLQPPITRYLFRADTPQAPRAEKLLLDATSEVDRLSELLLGFSMDTRLLCHHSHMEVVDCSDQELLVNGAQHFIAAKECMKRQDKSPLMEICQRLVNLSVYLHALQVSRTSQHSTRYVTDTVYSSTQIIQRGPEVNSTTTQNSSVQEADCAKSNGGAGEGGLEAGCVAGPGDGRTRRRQDQAAAWKPQMVAQQAMKAGRAPRTLQREQTKAGMSFWSGVVVNAVYSGKGVGRATNPPADRAANPLARHTAAVLQNLQQKQKLEQRYQEMQAITYARSEQTKRIAVKNKLTGNMNRTDTLPLADDLMSKPLSMQSETEISGVYNMQANQDSVHQSSLQQVIDLEVYVTSDDDDDGTASESSKDLHDIQEEI
ncbi:rho guanine nucleotide exchange factor 2-like [Neolamprologus brichardi]|uniref:rho guanine nucleotide exchange factor 2-like n=1 Tax=Neolamprologus brichardi TaxID=32507 RepID=UPI0016436B73|nr:rho guanine nucleotide exchange factor 2-like [Neolamprologus brichardi]